MSDLLPAWRQRERPRFRVAEKHHHGPCRPTYNVMLTNPRDRAKWPRGFVVMSFASRTEADRTKQELESRYHG